MKAIYFSNTGETAIGDLWLAASENGLVAIEFPSTQAEFAALLAKKYSERLIFAPEKLDEIVRQLREYAEGRRKQFDLSIDWSGMREFQQKALRATFAIPYGQTRTYQEIALEIGSPRGARAVGRAEATNPIPVVIPCHRVVGADHKLHGYGAGEGLDTKAKLLRLEGALIE